MGIGKLRSSWYL